jgi:hypothetical protein
MSDHICSICLFEFDDINSTYLTTCNHTYHKECINCWCRSSSKCNKVCPLCKQNLNFDEIIEFDKLFCVSSYDEFITLHGVKVFGNTLILCLNTSDWKNVLKKLIILSCIQSQINSFSIQRTLLTVTNNEGVEMKIVFALTNVVFNICHNEYIISNNVNVSLNSINDLELENLKFLDKFFLELTHNHNDQHSFLKYTQFDDDRVNILKTIVTFDTTYKPINSITKEKYDIKKIKHGKCSVLVQPQQMQLNGRIFYKLKGCLMEISELY